VLGEASEVCSDGILRGGIGGVAACDVAAGARRRCGRARPLRFDFELLMRQVLRLQGAFTTLRFQELLDGYSSRFGHKILHHYLYDPLFLAFFTCIMTWHNDDGLSLEGIIHSALGITLLEHLVFSRPFYDVEGGGYVA